MASKIRIFRSTGATAPGSLEYGELAVTIEQGTAGTSSNKAGRLFVGNASGNPVEIGGEYTYKLMDHTHGELINSSVAIVDGSGQINGWSVAGILTATRTDITDLVAGNLNITGVSTFAGGFNLNGNVTIGDSHLDILTVNSRTGFNTDVTINEKLLVTGISTFTSAVDMNGGLDVSGGVGLVVGSNGLNVTGVSTFNNDVLFSGTIDVDGQAIFDDITVSAAATFTGAVDMNGGLDVSGGETVLSSATVSDLTQNRVVLAGASGALTDSANLTFASNILDVDGTVDAGTAVHSPVGIITTLSGTSATYTTVDAETVDAGTNLFAVAGVVTTLSGTSATYTTVDAGTVDAGTNLFAVVGVVTTLTSTDFVGAAGTFTTAFTLGSGGTKYSFPVTDGTADQILVTNGSGTLSFQDVSSTLVISAGYASTDPVNLLTDTFTIAATANETRTTLSDNTITVGLSTDVIIANDLTVSNDVLILGNLTVQGTETILNVERLDIQDKTIGVASTSTASNTTADGAGFFVHAGSDGDKTIFWSLTQTGFEVNQHWLPNADGTFDLGNASREWQNLFVDGLAELDDVNVSAAATINTLNVTGTGTIATVDINAGNIDGTTIGAASSAAATFTTVNYTSLTGGAINATGSRIDAGDVTFTNLRVTGVSTVASLFLSTGTNTNGVAYFDASGQVTSTATPSAGIQTSNYILTTNASGVPSWTDTIDGGTF